jgi:hypothetical protein
MVFLCKRRQELDSSSFPRIGMPAELVPYIAMCKPKHDLQPPAKLYLLPTIVSPCPAS